VLARTQSWVESWNRVKDLPEDELKVYLVEMPQRVSDGQEAVTRQRDAWTVPRSLTTTAR
jgi:hypothetical protein